MGLLNEIARGALNSARYAIQSEVNSEVRKAVHSASDMLKDAVKSSSDNKKKNPADEYADTIEKDGTWGDFEKRAKAQGLEETTKNLQEKYNELFESGKGDELSDTEKMEALINYSANFTASASKEMSSLAGTTGDVIHHAAEKTNNPKAKAYLAEKEKIARKRQEDALKVAKMHEDYAKKNKSPLEDGAERKVPSMDEDDRKLYLDELESIGSRFEASCSG
jgi:hypothetical protein